MCEFLFDVTIHAAIRVTAETPEQAMETIMERIDCVDATFGCGEIGVQLVGEATAHSADLVDDDDCSECGEPCDDGEGWDGLCGNCADKASRA